MILTARTGALVGRTALRAGDVLRVGCGDDADLGVPHDRAMAPLHASLAVEPHGCRVRDLGSPGGTLVFGQRVTEVFARHGSPIACGHTEISTSADEEPVARASAVIREVSWTAEPAEQGVAAPLALLGGRPQLFALLDAARDRGVTAALKRGGERYASLFSGEHGGPLATHAPYLVELPPGSRLTGTLVTEAWGRSWGIFFTSDAPFEEVVASLQHLLFVHDDEGRQLYFRFYDPRVLRAFLPLTTVTQARLLFDVARTFIMEAEAPRTALVFGRIARP